MTLNHWWKQVTIVGLSLEALMAATGAPGYFFLIVGGATLLIGLLWPLWLESLKVAFAPGQPALSRLIAWLAPWGILSGANLLLTAAGAILLCVVGAILNLLSLFY